MKKNFLFAMLAVFLAGAGFGGISMAETTDTESETSTESTTCTANCVAKIGEIQYATLAEAIEAAKEGETITLLEDITLNKNVIISNNINIDLGNHMMNGGQYFLGFNGATSEISNGTIKSNSYVVALGNNANVTIKNGTYESEKGTAISANNSTLTIENANVTAQEVAVLATTNSIVTINDGTYTTRDNFVVGTNGSAGKGLNTITINGGTFNGNIQSEGYIACGIYAPNDDTITVNGGTFNITNGVGVAIRAGKVNIGENAIFKYTAGNISEGYVGDSKVKLPAGNKIVIDLRAGYPGLNDNTFKVESKKNNNDTFTNQLYVIEDSEPSFSSKDADDIEITKKSNENKVEIKGGTFSEDVTENTAEGMCSIKNSDGKYEVKVCPTASETFVTSKGTELPIVYDENKTIKLAETQALFKKKPIPSDPQDAAILNAIKTAEELTGTEIVEIESEDVLFFDVSAAIPTIKQTKAFRKSGSTLFSENAFKDGSTDTGSITYDIDKAVNPTWVTPNIEKVTSYNTVSKDTKVIGYMLNMDDEGDGWFYAPRMYKITFNTNGGAEEYEAQKVALTEGKVTNPGIPTKEGSGFKFWSLSNEESATEYDFSTVVADDITLYAIYGDDAFTITWKIGNDIINTGVFASGAMPAYVGDAPSKDADSTCNAYEFKEWTPSVTAVTDEATYTATFTCTSPKSSKSSGGGGGGGGSSKTSTKTDDTKATTGDTAKVDENNIENNNEENVNEENKDGETVATMTDAQAVEKFGQEQIDAYKWALENGITTMKTVGAARLDEPLTRAELAKMMVVYIQKVLEKDPIVTGDVAYPDVDESLGDLYGYIKLAYQYQIMGINADGTPIEFFNPYGIVTRGEYATVFSRVLFGDKFNKDGEDFYSKHLEALKAAGILTNTIPTIHEMRGWVMLMMYRSSQNTEAIEKVANTTEATEEESSDETVNEEKASEENENTEESTANNNEEVATENAEETTEAEATEVATGDVAEATAAEASTGDVATN